MMNKISTKYRCSIPGCLEMNVKLDNETVVMKNVTDLNGVVT